MSLRNNFILKASMGFSIGIVVGMIITAITTTLSAHDGNIYIYNTILAERIGNIFISFSIELLCYGLLGTFGMGGMALTYENEKCSLLMATILHFIIVMITFTIVGFYLSWFDTEKMGANIIFYLCLIMAYVMIWIIQSAIFKKEIREINLGINRLKAKKLGVKA